MEKIKVCQKTKTIYQLKLKKITEYVNHILGLLIDKDLNFKL